MRIISKIAEFLSDLGDQDADTDIAMGIVTTSYEFADPYFSFPRFIDRWGYYIHVVCADSEQANSIINHFKPQVRVFFLDMEPKKPDFSASEIINYNQDLSFRPLYPNFITVKAALDVLDSDLGRLPLIFGHGDIAFQLASNLTARGVTFRWIASRVSKSVKYLKMKHTFGHDEIVSVDQMGDVYLNTGMLIACFSVDVATLLKLAPEAGIKLVDVSGRIVISGDYENIPLKLDISARLVSDVSFALVGNRYKENIGRSVDDTGRSFVSGGYPGVRGDFVVDSFKNPSFIIGIADGCGGFLERVNKKF